MTEQSETIIHKERLWPSIGFFLATLLIIPSMTVLFMPFSMYNGIFVGIGLYLVVILSFSFGAPKVTLYKNQLHAGRGKIEIKNLGEAIPLDKVTYRQEIGRKLDARAFLVMNGWVKTGVKVVIKDENDPVPYWIVSTRKPQELASKINELEK